MEIERSVWFLGFVWFCFVWFGLVWFGLVFLSVWNARSFVLVVLFLSREGLSVGPSQLRRQLLQQRASNYIYANLGSGRTNPNCAISRSSGRRAEPWKAWREEVLVGQEVSASYVAHLQPSIQETAGAGRLA